MSTPTQATYQEVDVRNWFLERMKRGLLIDNQMYDSIILALEEEMSCLGLLVKLSGTSKGGLQRVLLRVNFYLELTRHE